MTVKDAVLASLLVCLLLSPGCQAAIPKGKTAEKSVQQRLPAPLQSLATPTLPSQLELRFSWTGVGGRVPDHLYHLKYLPQQKQYQVRHERFSLSGVKDQPSSSSLAADLVSAVFSKLSSAGWTPTQEALSESVRTDDYPVYRLSFGVAGHRVEIFSLSSTPNAVPWNLRFDKTLYASNNQALGESLFQLFKQLQQAHPAR